MQILIAGGGIGGLTAALCLHQSGHDVHVLEQSAAFVPEGAGLQCGANALKVLNHLGLLEQLRTFSVAPERVDFRDYKSGSLLSQLNLGTQYRERFGAPYWHLHRADLHQVLLRAFNERSPNSIAMGARVESYVESDNSITVCATNEREFTADCLVAADGIRSQVRSQMQGRDTARYTGHTAWRAVVPVERLPHNWMEKIVSNFVGPKKHAILYYVSGGAFANLVGVVEHRSLQSDSWVNQAPWEELRDDFTGWHPTVTNIVDAVDKDQCYRWSLFDHPPTASWRSRRAVLLGDAAHASLPFMASGAAMAIEDARILDRALSTFNVVPLALKSYELTRKPRTSYVQRTSAKMGSLYHLESSMMRRLAFKGFDIAMRSRDSILPSYDANQVELIQPIKDPQDQ